MEDRETARMRKYEESKTTRIMMATVPHVTSGLGLRKFQADGFLLTRVYMHWSFSSRRTSRTFCLIKIGPFRAPNNNEKIQWSTCQGNNSGLEEGIPWQSWCLCRVYLARACMQHMSGLIQLYLQTSNHPSPAAHDPHCNNSQPRPTNGLFSLVSRNWSL